MNLEKRNKMIEDNLALVTYSLQLLKIPYNEDYFQQGVLELIRCVDNFTEDKGTKFSTYAINNIKWYLKEYIQRDFIIKPKRIKCSGGKVDRISIDSLNREVCRDAKMITLQETIQDKRSLRNIEHVLEEIDLNNFFRYSHKIFGLKIENINLFKDFYLNGYNKKELSDKYKLTYKQLNKRLDEIRNILKRSYLSYNIN